MAKLIVDKRLCTGHGRCYSVAPDFLSEDEEGYVTIRGTSIGVPPEKLSDAHEAVDACPEGAMSLLKDGEAGTPDNLDGLAK